MRVKMIIFIFAAQKNYNSEDYFFDFEFFELDNVHFGEHKNSEKGPLRNIFFHFLELKNTNFGAHKK